MQIDACLSALQLAWDILWRSNPPNTVRWGGGVGVDWLGGVILFFWLRCTQHGMLHILAVLWALKKNIRPQST